jgi:UDP-3-O-[3-hydroxymyristoyl] glucosamine N-acyltransferase
MEFTAAQIAELLQGTVEGDGDVSVHTLSKIEEGGKGGLSFLANPQYTPYIYTTSASAVIVNNDFIAEREISATLIRVPNAYEAFAKLLELYNKIKHEKKGIEQPVFIDETAKVPDDIYLGAFAYIGKNVAIGSGSKIYSQVYIGDNVRIGKNALIFPGVKILADTQIGDSVTLHAGVVIGADGFGFAPNSSDSFSKVAQIGNVIIEDHVEVGANSSIDRATLGSTIIRKGVKLDNLIQIAHNVEIGENTVIAAQTGVAGSTRIGANCMIGGQVGIVGHLTIGNRVRIAAQSGIGSNLADDTIWQGSPAFDHRDYLKSYVMFRKLPSIIQDIKEKLSKQNS